MRSLNKKQKRAEGIRSFLHIARRCLRVQVRLKERKAPAEGRWQRNVCRNVRRVKEFEGRKGGNFRIGGQVCRLRARPLVRRGELVFAGKFGNACGHVPFDVRKYVLVPPLFSERKIRYARAVQKRFRLLRGEVGADRKKAVHTL